MSIIPYLLSLGYPSVQTQTEPDLTDFDLGPNKKRNMDHGPNQIKLRQDRNRTEQIKLIRDLSF